MKKIILILMLFFTYLHAENNTTLEEILLLKTEKNISLNEIQSHSSAFKPIEKDENFASENLHYWLKVKLNSEMKTGMYLVRYAPVDFDKASFSSSQNMYKLESVGIRKFSFSYDKSRDEQYYYFHLSTPAKYLTETKSLISIVSMEAFMKDTIDYIVYILFCGLVYGIILMAGMYNAFIYFYNREVAFLYYALMQFFMVSVLFFLTGFISTTGENLQLYNFLSLMTALFATQFIRSFLNTSKHLPKVDRFLQFYLLFIGIDLLLNAFFSYSIIEDFSLYSIFGLFYLLAGYLRLKQGFKPAKIFLIGWSALILSLFFVEYLEEYLLIDVLLIGSPIEAIFLAIALAHKIKLIQNEQEQQKELLVHQSKLASMGEMIGNIAHQWRQPLTHLSYTVMNIQDAFKHKSLDEVYLDNKVEEANRQIEFMSQTIDDFKDFYAPKKSREKFSLVDETRQVLSIVSYSLEEQDIEVELIVKADEEIVNYKNEFKQVLLNLLTNAKDALVKNVILNPKIIIIIDKNEITIADNAGGIEPKIIHKIFEPYFTTKEEHSGIGLYMSKMIIEKNMGGELRVKNIDGGAEFSIIF